MFRIYLRSHAPDETGLVLERIDQTQDAAAAESSYRRFLARDDLAGKPVAAVLSSNAATGGGSGSAIYFSRFDREIGDGRIHPDAPLDLSRTDDGTMDATLWHPTAPMSIDYEADPRPFAECLKDFAARVNGGRSYGARPRAAAELRVSEINLRNWMEGRPCAQEAALRRLMTLISG